MTETCNECGEEIRIAVDKMIDLSSSGKRFAPGKKEFCLKIVAKCGCMKIGPKATELGSISFSGKPPDRWQ